MPVAMESGAIVSDGEKMHALVELAGAVAHELNNIFTAVSGNLSLLDDQLDDGDEAKARVNDVIRTAQRGIALSSKLQAFAGRQPLKRKRVDVNMLVGRVVQDLPMASLDGIHVRALFAREACCSFVDEDKLRSAVHEVLHNAIAATAKGGQITVETRLYTAAETPAPNMPALRPGRYVMIAVSDTGKGMPPDVAARAVEPLFTTKTPGINAGWGLSACAGLVRQCGGYMTLASKVGLGTRVEFYLPLQQG
jgi:signal transduction histidine kinase